MRVSRQRLLLLTGPCLVAGFILDGPQIRRPSTSLPLSKGFGGGGFGASSGKKAGKKKGGKSSRLANTLADKPKKSGSANKPFVKSEQDQLLEQLASQAANTCIGRANNSRFFPILSFHYPHFCRRKTPRNAPCLHPLHHPSGEFWENRFFIHQTGYHLLERNFLAPKLL